MSESTIIPAFLLISYSIINAVPTRRNDGVRSEFSTRESYPRQNQPYSQQDYTAADPSNVPPNIERQMENYSYRTPILHRDLVSRHWHYSALTNTTYNSAILGFGVSNFMSYAAHFCKDEGRNGAFEVISVGSGDGTVDNGIIEAYREHFGEELSITLVDKDPQFKVDFKTVKELIEKRPNVVGNCVLLIFWPEADDNNDGYDIDAVGELQPLATLVLYETTGLSGSQRFQTFVGDESKRDYQRRWAGYKNESLGLENYAIKEVAFQRVNLRAGKRRVESFNVTWIQEPGERAYSFRMVKLKRIGDYKPIRTSCSRREKNVGEMLASSNLSAIN